MGNPIGPGMFKAALADTPRKAFNWRLALSVICFALLGVARGLDEGLIGTTVAQKSFIAEYDLKTSSHLDEKQLARRIGNMAAMVQIGSVGGALIAFIFCDKIGRIWATRGLCLTWIAGVVIFITSVGNYNQALVGRLIMGFGIGQTTVVAPSYLAEVAPRSIRGLCIGLFSGSVYLGVMLGYFANWGTSLHISDNSPQQWIDPTIMHVLFAVIIITMSCFALESPRWLAKVGRDEEARSNMLKLRNLPLEHPYVQAELTDIYDEIKRERESTLNSGFFGPLKELFLDPSICFRILLALGCQLLSQWSGANSITMYAPKFFALLGKNGPSEQLSSTSIFGVVKLASAIICAVFLVDFLGRKRSLIAGIVLQAICVLYIAIYLTCMPQVVPQSLAAKIATQFAMAAVYGLGASWALGWNSIMYLIGAEIYPLRVRSLGVSLTMCFHFACQYGNSKAVPLMLLEQPDGLGPKGTFWFFTAVTLVGLAFVWFFMPETAGRSLESMDELFALPWYAIGRKGAELTVGKDNVAETLVSGDENETTKVVKREERVEGV